MNAAWALQQAVYAVLCADAAVKALVGARVFDAVPRRALFPYIVIGEAEETAAGTATDDAVEHMFTVEVWSRGGGHRDVKAIADAIRTALQTSPPSPSGHTLVDVVFVSAAYTRQSDGETTRAGLRFRAVTEPQ